MKKLSFLVGALFISAMSFADVTPKVTLDFTDNTDWGFPTTATKTTASFTDANGYTISLADGSESAGYKFNSDYLMFGKTDATLTLPTFEFNVSKIVVTGTSGASTAVVVNVYVGSTAVSTQTTGLKDVVNTYNIAAGHQAAGNQYVIKVCSKHNAQVSKIEIYEATAGAPELPTFSKASGVYTSAQEVEISCSTEGADIYYTLDGAEPTSSSEQYVGSLNILETTTVKAIAIKAGVSSEVATANFTIISLEGEGTEENPFTCADVIKLNNSLGTAEEYWVVGYIIGGVKSENNALVTDNKVASAIGLADAKGVENPDIAVQLENSSSARTALNVVDNEGKIGAKVKVKGTLEAYCNKPGVKGVGAAADYVIVEEPVTAIESVEVSNIYGVNGTIYGAEGARIYTITGMDVTEQNGSLNGAYIVRMGDKSVKVIVK